MNNFWTDRKRSIEKYDAAFFVLNQKVKIELLNKWKDFNELFEQIVDVDKIISKRILYTGSNNWIVANKKISEGIVKLFGNNNMAIHRGFSINLNNSHVLYYSIKIKKDEIIVGKGAIPFNTNNDLIPLKYFSKIKIERFKP